MAFVSLQGGNRYKGKTTQTATNESDSAHASPVILQTYASRSTVTAMSREQYIAILRDVIYKRNKIGRNTDPSWTP